MSKISILGVVVGAVVDIVATNIVTIPLVVFIAYKLAKSGLSPEQVQAAIIDAMRTDTTYFTIGMLLGSLCSILGGYISAKIAKKSELLNGGLASFLCIGSGICSWAFVNSPYPWWYHVLAILLSGSLATLGGYFCLKRRAKFGA
jgi:hypothetical protein